VLIRLGYDMEFEIPAPVAMVAVLRVHSTRSGDLLEPDEIRTDPRVEVTYYYDRFGNHCGRFVAPAGKFRLYTSTLIKDSGQTDAVNFAARQLPVEELPVETMHYLLNSRYCEVDLMSHVATELFGATRPGWERVQAICDWVHQKVLFGYNFARANKTALDVFTERNGVCRDFQHLAITFCRCMNIPARYATGYLGDIRVPPAGPMDFSAWFEVYLEDRWWVFDARNNQPRIGRILIAEGRDAADVALTTSFGMAILKNFLVVSDEETEGSLAIRS
jgi:transglutaminase-like putative cysteine protease